jgi:hypothetical protein
MAIIYDYKNIKVDYLSLEDIDNEKYNKKLIIYPVLEYKVFAPIFDDIKLNIFQKTVLSILNKGKYDVNQIAQWLCMDKLLVQTILAELQIKGLFDSKSNNITKEGEELIDGTFSWFTNSENLKKDIRYIYQDLYTNNLYPVLIDKEAFDNVLYLQDENKALVINTKEKGKEFIKCELIEPNGKVLNYISRPNNKEMFEVINEHSKVYIENSDKNIDTIPEAIQLLCDEPTLTYIATWIYIDKNNKNIDEIQISDPFNIYDNGYYLKDNIEVASKSNDRLKEAIESLVIDAKEKENEQMGEIFKKIDFATIQYLNTTFNNTLKEYDTLYDGLKSYFKSFEQYKVEKDIQFIKNSISKGQSIFETFFEVIQKEYPTGYKKVYDQNIKTNSKNNRDRFYSIPVEELELKIKKINPNCKIPKFTYKSFSNLGKCISNTKGSLRDLYIGAMLASYEDNTNPMYQLLKQKDNLLVLLGDIIPELRNKTEAHKHIIIKDEEEYYSKALKIKSDTEQIIKIFLKEVNNG